MDVFGIDFRLTAAGTRRGITHPTLRRAALFRPSPPRSRRSLRSRSHRPATTGRGRAATRTTKATRPWKRILAARRVDVATVRWANDSATSGSEPSAVGGQICEPRANRAARRGIAGRRTRKTRVSPVTSRLRKVCFAPPTLPTPPNGWGDSLQPHTRSLVQLVPATRMLLVQNASESETSHLAGGV